MEETTSHRKLADTKTKLEHEDKTEILFGSAPYHVVDHRHSIAEFLAQLQALDVTNLAIPKLHVDLWKDSIIADVNGPASDIAEMKKNYLWTGSWCWATVGVQALSFALTLTYHRCIKMGKTPISGFRPLAETRRAERTPWILRASRVKTCALRHMATVDLQTWMTSTRTRQ